VSFVWVLRSYFVLMCFAKALCNTKNWKSLKGNRYTIRCSRVQLWEIWRTDLGVCDWREYDISNWLRCMWLLLLFPSWCWNSVLLAATIKIYWIFQLCVFCCRSFPVQVYQQNSMENHEDVSLLVHFILKHCINNKETVHVWYLCSCIPRKRNNKHFIQFMIYFPWLTR